VSTVVSFFLFRNPIHMSCCQLAVGEKNDSTGLDHAGCLRKSMTLFWHWGITRTTLQQSHHCMSMDGGKFELHLWIIAMLYYQTTPLPHFRHVITKCLQHFCGQIDGAWVRLLQAAEIHWKHCKDFVTTWIVHLDFKMMECQAECSYYTTWTLHKFYISTPVVCHRHQIVPSSW